MKLDWIKLDGAKKVVKIVGAAVSSHKSDIATGAGIALAVGGAILAYREGMRAEGRILQEKEYRFYEKSDHPEETTPTLEDLAWVDISLKDTVLLTYKYMLVPVLMVVGGVSMILIARKSDKNASNALAAAYAVSESNLKDLKDAIDQTIDGNKKKQEEFNSNLAQAKADNRPVDDTTVKSYGECSPESPVLFKDAYTGEEFWSTIDDVLHAGAAYNSKIAGTFEGYESYNLFRALTKRVDDYVPKFAEEYGHRQGHLMQLPDYRNGECFRSIVIRSGVNMGKPALLLEEEGDGPVLLTELGY